MNQIVRLHYPVSKLPEDLREGLNPSGEVTVTLLEETPSRTVLSLEEMFALRRPPYLSKEEIDAHIREMREEWDERG